MSRPGLGDREGPLTEYQAAAAHYRDDFGWHAGTFGDAVWVLASHPVEALSAPSSLGRRVLESGVDTPVFEAPDAYVFLTGDRDHQWPAFIAPLTALGVEHIWAGQYLDLPPTRTVDGQLTWIIEPSRTLPDFRCVAEVLLANR